MCSHLWTYERTKRAKRAGILTTSSRYVCVLCNKRKYKAGLSYVRIAGIQRANAASYRDEAAELRTQLANVRAELVQAERLARANEAELLDTLDRMARG